MRFISKIKFVHSTFAIIASMLTSHVLSHGGVAFQEDQCVITVDFMQAHFTVFQPETRESEEFCEDIPDVTGSVFVMEYLHELLQEMHVDFRIIRDVNNIGRFAGWSDVQAMDDLESATVYYQAASVEDSGYYRASYTFEERGTYIGIVTAEQPGDDQSHNAVFYFQVGGRNWGTIPVFGLLLILCQLSYWYYNGGFDRYSRGKQQSRGR